MTFEEQVTHLSAGMLKNLTIEATEKGVDNLVSEVTAKALQHYSLLFLFLNESGLTGDFVEWINAKRFDQAYGTDTVAS